MLIWAAGFDDWVAQGGGGAPAERARHFDDTSGGTTVATGGRFGGGYWSLNDGNWGEKIIDPLGTKNYQTIIMGMAWFPDTGWSGADAIFRWMNIQRNSHASVFAIDGGQLEIRDANGTIVATSAAALTIEAWHWVEAKLTMGASGSLEVRVNQGASQSDVFVSASAQDFLHATGDADIRVVRWEGGATFNRVDDIQVNDTEGSVNNDFIGDGRIHHLRPTEDVIAEFARVGAGSNNYEVVDETPRDAADYVTSPFDGNQDRYGYGNLPAAPDKVDWVGIQASLLKSDGGGTKAKLHIKSGAVVDESEAKTILTNSRYYQHFLDTDPNTGAAWTRAAVDGIEGGVKVAT